MKSFHVVAVLLVALFATSRATHAQSEQLRAVGFDIVARNDAFATNLGGTNFGFIAAQRP